MRRTLLRIIEHFHPNEYFRTSYSVGTAAALGDHIHKKIWTLRNKFLRPLCKNIYRKKRDNISGKRITGETFVSLLPSQKRCPGSFIQCIYNYCHLQKKCPLHHPRKNLSGFKTRLIAVAFHVRMSFEITFNSDYSFCT